MATSETSTIERVAFLLLLVVTFTIGLNKPTIDLRIAEISFPDLIFPLVFVCLLASMMVGSSRLRAHPAYLAFLIYLLALCISTTMSGNRPLSGVKLAGTLYLLLLATAVFNLVTTESRLKWIVLVWLGGAIIPALASLFAAVLLYSTPDSSLLPELLYHSGSTPIGSYPRLNSTLVSPSLFCNYLTVVSVISLGSIRMNWIGDGVGWAIVGGCAAIALFTFSIALGGLFLAIGLAIFALNRRRFLSWAALSIGLLIGVAFLAIAPVSLTRLGESSPRVAVWSQSGQTFREHPVFGKGLGTAAASVQFQNSDGSWSILTDAHNTFLNVAAGAGILGLTGLLFILVIVLRSAFLSKTDEHLRPIRIALGVAFVIAFLYDGLTGSFEEARHLWLLMGLIFAAENLEEAG